MLKIFTYFFILLIATIGLSDIIHFIWMLFLKPKIPSTKSVICYLDGVSDYLNLKYVYEMYRWFGSDYASELIAVYDTIPGEDIVEEFSMKGFKFIDKRNFFIAEI